jgi:hypothetical protein
MTTVTVKYQMVVHPPPNNYLNQIHICTGKLNALPVRFLLANMELIFILLANMELIFQDLRVGGHHHLVLHGPKDAT